MTKYIHQRAGWPKFRLNQESLAARLAAVRHLQGRLIDSRARPERRALRHFALTL
jgi:hypothetical protein